MYFFAKNSSIQYVLTTNCEHFFIIFPNDSHSIRRAIYPPSQSCFFFRNLHASLELSHFSFSCTAFSSISSVRFFQKYLAWDISRLHHFIHFFSSFCLPLYLVLVRIVCIVWCKWCAIFFVVSRICLVLYESRAEVYRINSPPKSCTVLLCV